MSSPPFSRSRLNNIAKGLDSDAPKRVYMVNPQSPSGPEIIIQIEPEKVFTPDLVFEEVIPELPVISYQAALDIIDTLMNYDVIAEHDVPSLTAALIHVCEHKDLLRQGTFLRYCVNNNDETTWSTVFNELHERHIPLTAAWYSVDAKMTCRDLPASIPEEFNAPSSLN